MSFWARIIRCIKEPRRIVVFLNERGFSKLFPDKFLLKCKYHYRTGLELNLKSPKTFNEKLQWLKLYDRKLEYMTMVDKYAVKQWVKEKLGEGYAIPTLGVWKSFQEIDFDTLPHAFVLKPTHDSGSIVICKDKASFDRDSAEKRISKSMKRNYYYVSREWPYKSISPKIIAEPFLVDASGELRDYKFFCFSGKVKCVKVDFGRFTKHQANYYDRDMNFLPFGEAAYPFQEDFIIEKPDEWDEMVRVAESLSSGTIFLRVDLYNVHGKIYFGETTFYPASGFGEIAPSEWNERLGSWIHLPFEEVNR